MIMIQVLTLIVGGRHYVLLRLDVVVRDNILMSSSMLLNCSIITPDLSTLSLFYRGWGFAKNNIFTQIRTILLRVDHFNEVHGG